VLYFQYNKETYSKTCQDRPTKKLWQKTPQWNNLCPDYWLQVGMACQKDTGDDSIATLRLKRWQDLECGWSSIVQSNQLGTIMFSFAKPHATDMRKLDPDATW